MANQTIMPLETFVDHLIEQAGFTHLPEAYRITYRDQLLSQVYQRIGAIALKELPEKDVDAYLEHFKDFTKTDVNAVQQFLMDHIENFSEKLQTGLEQFANEFIANVKNN